MTRKYHVCGWPVDSVTHFRACVPKKQWPEWMRAPLHQVLPDGTVEPLPLADAYRVDESGVVSPAPMCECGFEAKSTAGLASHRLRSVAHTQPLGNEPTNIGTDILHALLSEQDPALYREADVNA